MDFRVHSESEIDRFVGFLSIHWFQERERERDKDDFYGDYRRDTDRDDRRRHRSRNDFYRHDERR